MELKRIAVMKCDFPTKFGLPRQSGLVEEVRGKIVFEKEYSSPEAIRGLDGYSHIWVIWGFSESGDKWSPTVRPPRLGGNKRMGVFATRSPFRPNPIGLSCLKLEAVNISNGVITLDVSGIDMMDDTPIYDIKPYLPFTDIRSDAVGGFADKVKGESVTVNIPDELIALLTEDKRNALIGILKEDPRPHYQNDPGREYGFDYAGYEIKFTAENGVINVTSVRSKNAY